MGAEGRGAGPDSPPHELAGCAGEVPRPRAVDVYALTSGGQKAKTTVSLHPVALGKGGPYPFQPLVAPGCHRHPWHMATSPQSLPPQSRGQLPGCAHVRVFLCV